MYVYMYTYICTYARIAARLPQAQLKEIEENLEGLGAKKAAELTEATGVWESAAPFQEESKVVVHQTLSSTYYIVYSIACSTKYIVNSI